MCVVYMHLKVDIDTEISGSAYLYLLSELFQILSKSGNLYNITWI